MMNYSKYVALVFLLVAAMSSQAAAGEYYIGVQGGGDFLPDAKASDLDGRFNMSYDFGYDASVTLGYNLGKDYPRIGYGRIELEFNSASNDMKDAEFVEGTVAVDGSIQRTSIMLNTIGEYSYESGLFIYALLGLGWAQISLENVSILGEPFVDDKNSQLAYQAGLGFGWKLSSHFVLDLGYRYYGTTSPAFTKQDGTSLDYEYDSHRLLAGVRLNF